MTVSQSFRIYEILQHRLKDSDKAKMILHEIEQIIGTKKDRFIMQSELVSKRIDSLKSQIETEKKFGKNILSIISAVMGNHFILLILIKLFLIK